MSNPENKNKRIHGAHAKGKAAKGASKSREDNPYERPTMKAAWFAGFDGEQCPERK